MNSKEVIKILKQNGFEQDRQKGSHKHFRHLDGRKMRYFAKFKKEKEGGYSVSFPLLKGCFSEGNSYDEAKAMATEALSLWLESALEYDEAIPVPKEYIGEEYVAIKVPAYLAVKVQLKTANATSKRLEVNFA